MSRTGFRVVGFVCAFLCAACGMEQQEAVSTSQAALTRTFTPTDIEGVHCLIGDTACLAGGGIGTGSYPSFEDVLLVGDDSKPINCNYCRSAGGSCTNEQFGTGSCNCRVNSSGGTNSDSDTASCRQSVCATYPDQPGDFCSKKNAQVEFQAY